MKLIFDFSRSRIRNKYKDLLAYLKTQDEIPYLDYNEKGKLITMNTQGDYRRSRKMNEAINMIKEQHGCSTGDAWKILKEEIQKDRSFALYWFFNMKANEDQISPLCFLIGSRRNCYKLRDILCKCDRDLENYTYRIEVKSINMAVEMEKHRIRSKEA